MSNITRPQMTREEAMAFYALRKIGGGCANAGLAWFENEVEKLHATGSELESNLHRAVTEGAKTCNKLNDVIQSKDAAISAGHNLLMEESADNSYLVGKINSIHRWYCWSIFTIASAAIASHFIWG